MTSTERARAFLHAHLGQTVSMEMFRELSEAFEDHRRDHPKDHREEPGKGERQLPLRAVADIDEEVDDDPTE
jgi:hypothetical protein